MEDSDVRAAAGRLTAATAGNGEEPAGSAAAAGRPVVKQRLPHGKPAHNRGQATLAHSHAQVSHRAGTVFLFAIVNARRGFEVVNARWKMLEVAFSFSFNRDRESSPTAPKNGGLGTIWFTVPKVFCKPLFEMDVGSILICHDFCFQACQFLPITACFFQFRK